MANDFAARRVPRQARGERRVTAILDAAAQVLGEVGYDAMTVSAVAERARTPIGSVYQFYANKEAIGQAVAERYLGELIEYSDAALVPIAARLPLPALVDTLLDPYIEFVAVRPGYLALLGNTKAIKLLPAKAALEQALVGRLADLFAAHGNVQQPEQVRLWATLTMHLVGALAPLAIMPDGTIDAAMRDEIKAALLGYLGPRLGAAR